MKEKGWRPFWAALLAALLVLLPLAGGTVLLTRRSLRTRLASRPQSGVAIRQPKEENRLSLLVCIAPTETTAPGFLLLYLNASQNCIHALALPGELTVPFGADEASLADCYRAAGPARCREALLSALSLPEDTHYLALAPSVLQAIADRYGMLRVGFSGALTAEELALTGCSSNVQAISAREAEELLNGMEDTVPPAHKAAARAAALWAGGTVSSIPLSSSSASRAEMACTLELHPVRASSSAVSAPEKPTRSIPYRSAMACRTDGARAR